MATCAVSGKITDLSETAISGVTIKANLVTPAFSGTTNFVVPKEMSTTTAADGTWSLTMARSLSYIVAIEYPPNSTDSARRITYAVTVPNAATATFYSIASELY